MNKLIEILRTPNVGCRYGSQYMGVYCYADDLSLLSPSFTGLQEMLRLCELYAVDHNIIFNAKKSQLLYFGSNPSNDPCTVDLTMLNGQSIQHVKKCIHLGNELCPTNKHVVINNSSIYLITIYRPPPSQQNQLSTSTFLAEWAEFISQYTTSPAELVIMGDLSFSP